MNLLIILAILGAFSVSVVFPQRWTKKYLPHKNLDTSREDCRYGDGSSYRGSVSKSAYGSRCLSWSRFATTWGTSKGLGNHNHCRNPDKSLMPWCPVQRGRKVVKEFCDIPRCSQPPVKRPPVVDTELTCGERSEQKLNKIVGGSFTAIESHPWVAAIYLQNKGFLCGGSLISPCWVVSAAHCFFDSNQTNPKHLSVHLGKTAINETNLNKEQSFTVEKLIIHSRYNEDNFNNDIALLKIRGKDGECAIKSASSRVVCLPPLRTQLPAGFQCSIAGFGLEKSMAWHYSNHLKQAEVKLVSENVCKSDSYYGNAITRNMLCAGSPDWSEDACKGDSGGPLVCEVSGRMFLFGVVSWGEGCAMEDRPGVYTKVTNYNKWIAMKTGLSSFTKGLMYPTK
ncbi:uncharacterized protein V6R79_006013 [Siganus canaliculatus]